MCVDIKIYYFDNVIYAVSTDLTRDFHRKVLPVWGHPSGAASSFEGNLNSQPGEQLEELVYECKNKEWVSNHNDDRVWSS